MSAPRRIPRVGYLTCAICHRDLPADEFPDRGLRNKNGLPLRSSYCRTCNNEYLRQMRAMNKHDPEWCERRRRDSNLSYHRNGADERRDDLIRRRKDAKRELDKLTAAGFTDTQIGRLIGVNNWQVSNWSRGQGRPTDDHIRRLRTVIETIVEKLKGDTEA